MADTPPQRPWHELRRLRRNAGMTQTELARRARISQNYVSELEQGRRRGKAPVLMRIAHTFGLTVEALEATRDQDQQKVGAA